MVKSLSDQFRFILRKEGFQITPEIEQVIQEKAYEKEKVILYTMRAEGVPKIFKLLLECSNKREEELLFKDKKLSMDDFGPFIFNCKDLGLSHQRVVFDKIPEHLQLTDHDIKNFFLDRENSSEKDKKRAFSKIEQSFKQRKYMVGHLFRKDEKWYLFSFESHDLSPFERQHWKGGNHVHFVSHQWGKNLDPKKLLTDISNGKSNGASLHISIHHVYQDKFSKPFVEGDKPQTQ